MEQNFNRIIKYYGKIYPKPNKVSIKEENRYKNFSIIKISCSLEKNQCVKTRNTYTKNNILHNSSLIENNLINLITENINEINHI